jgi:2-dehydro-3-deoxyphosphooctonate aldolase (KDO 8-P synthase)
MVGPLAMAAMAAGADGLFLEVHSQPENALCDAATMLPIDKLSPLLKKLKAIHKIVKEDFPDTSA